MKTSIILFLFCIIANSNLAQISLYHTNHAVNIGTTDSVGIAKFTGIMNEISNGGADEFWNLSNTIGIDTSSSDNGLIEYLEIDTTIFTNADYAVRRFQKFPGYAQFVETIEMSDSNERATTGFRIAERIAFAIESDFTGPGDSMIYPMQEWTYTVQRPIVTFPCSFQSAWEIETQRVEKLFILNVPSFGYENAAGINVAYESYRDSIIGFGSLVINKTDNGINFLDTLDVLLLQSTFTSLDSVYLNGTPAPTMLVDGFFGKANGATSTTKAYKFLQENSVLPVVEFQLDMQNNLEKVYYDASIISPLVQTVGRNKKTFVQMEVFPNPAIDIICFKGNKPTSENWQISVVNASGQSILLDNISTQNNFELTINAQNWANGVYFYQLINQQGEVLHSNKFIKN